jgi:hypothetical protein
MAAKSFSSFFCLSPPALRLPGVVRDAIADINADGLCVGAAGCENNQAQGTDGHHPENVS